MPSDKITTKITEGAVSYDIKYQYGKIGYQKFRIMKGSGQIARWRTKIFTIFVLHTKNVPCDLLVKGHRLLNTSFLSVLCPDLEWKLLSDLIQVLNLLIFIQVQNVYSINYTTHITV